MSFISADVPPLHSHENSNTSSPIAVLTPPDSGRLSDFDAMESDLDFENVEQQNESQESIQQQATSVTPTQPTSLSPRKTSQGTPSPLKDLRSHPMIFDEEDLFLVLSFHRKLKNREKRNRKEHQTQAMARLAHKDAVETQWDRNHECTFVPKTTPIPSDIASKVMRRGSVWDRLDEDRRMFEWKSRKMIEKRKRQMERERKEQEEQMLLLQGVGATHHSTSKKKKKKTRPNTAGAAGMRKRRASTLVDITDPSIRSGTSVSAMAFTQLQSHILSSMNDELEDDHTEPSAYTELKRPSTTGTAHRGTKDAKRRTSSVSRSMRTIHPHRTSDVIANGKVFPLAKDRHLLTKSPDRLRMSPNQIFGPGGVPLLHDEKLPRMQSSKKPRSPFKARRRDTEPMPLGKSTQKNRSKTQSTSPSKKPLRRASEAMSKSAPRGSSSSKRQSSPKKRPSTSSVGSRRVVQQNAGDAQIIDPFMAQRRQQQLHEDKLATQNAEAVFTRLELGQSKGDWVQNTGFTTPSDSILLKDYGYANLDSDLTLYAFRNE